MKKLNIFITGVSSGIGKSAAVELCKSGHNVCGFARRSDKLKEISEQLSREDGEFLITEGDVRNATDVDKAVTQMTEKWGGIDVIIPNAGLGKFNPLDKGTMEEWKLMVDVNITGVLQIIHSCLPHLLKSKGHVVNIGSLASRQVFHNSGVYCATKHFVLAMSESIRMEFSGKLAVTTINPGAVNTEFISHTDNDDLRTEYEPNFESGMSPKFIADAIVEAVNSGGRGIYSEITLRPDRR